MCVCVHATVYLLYGSEDNLCGVGSLLAVGIQPGCRGDAASALLSHLPGTILPFLVRCTYLKRFSSWNILLLLEVPKMPFFFLPEVRPQRHLPMTGLSLSPVSADRAFGRSDGHGVNYLPGFGELLLTIISMFLNSKLRFKGSDEPCGSEVRLELLQFVAEFCRYDRNSQLRGSLDPLLHTGQAGRLILSFVQVSLWHPS